MKDWNGKAIKVGDLVRHAYEPWKAGTASPPSGVGYHSHFFAGAAKVVEEVNDTCVRIEQHGNYAPVFLGALLEVVPSREHAVMTPYIVPLAGPYMEPKAA